MATKKPKKATKGLKTKGLKKAKKLEKTLPLSGSDFSFTCNID